MIINRGLRFLSGYVVIRVEGRYPERFLNVCSRRGIHLWDVARLSPTALRCKISVRGFRLLPSVAHKSRCVATIVDKRGLPTVLRRWRRRKWFFVGAAVCLLASLSLNLYVWKIEVVGNERVPTDVILAELDRSGVRVGQLRFRLDEKALQNELVARIPQLSWLWIDKRGSKVRVEVKERALPPEMVDKSQPCHLVAARDGVIQSLNVRDGQNAVAPGDTVVAGQLLVSGVVDLGDGSVRLAHASGEALARTWYEQTRAFSTLRRVETPTGRVARRRTIRLFGLSLTVGKEPPFADYQQTVSQSKWAVGGLSLGVTVETVAYAEVRVDEESEPVDTVVARGAESLKAEIRRTADSRATVVREDASYVQPDDETVEVTVVAEYLENIARPIPASEREITPNS